MDELQKKQMEALYILRSYVPHPPLRGTQSQLGELWNDPIGSELEQG